MDEPRSPASSSDSWSEQFARAQSEQRTRIDQFQHDTLSRWDNLERDLAGHLERIADELKQEHQQYAGQKDDLNGRLAELTQQLATLQESEKQFVAREAELQELSEAARAESETQRQELQTAREELAARDKNFEAARQQSDSGERAFGKERDQLKRENARLELQLEKLQHREDKTKAQRKKIADKLKQQRAAITSQIQTRQEEMKRLFVDEQSQAKQALSVALAEKQELAVTLAKQHGQIGELKRNLATVTPERDELSNRLERQNEESTGSKAELQAAREQQRHLETQREASRKRQTELEQEINSLQQCKTELQAERDLLCQSKDELKRQLADTQASGPSNEASEQGLAASRAELADLRGQLEQAHTGAKTSEHRISDLEKELEDLANRLVDAEEQSTHPPKHAAESDELNDLHRRYEMSLEDVRDLKAKKAELERELAESHSSTAVGAHGLALDWEAQKRRMLEALEEEGELSESERLTLDEAIQRTDKVVATKDTRIAELEREVISISGAVPAAEEINAAIAGAVDTDEVVKQEREKLHDLQQEWEEKLRKAEVELSLERARIAHERADIEAKLADFEFQRQRAAPESAGSQKSSRGRWLSRLGLKDSPEK